MMAPDLNSMPTSPRPPNARQVSQPSSNTASRRTSQIMGPPSVPASAHYNHRSPTMSSMEQGVPLRHPRPLTAAELYLECEKEQEAVVNRLTRELSALRAQTASVASNASHSSNSTSASLLPVDLNDPNPAHQLTGATHPAPSRRNRSSSSLSSRSVTSPTAQATPGGGVPIGGISQASQDRAAAAAGLSRQPSGRASGTSTPARQSMEIARSGHLVAPHRPSISRDPSHGSSTLAHAGTPLPPSHPSPAQSPAGNQPGIAELSAYRAEMENVKAENEALKQRVRTLERALRTRRRGSSQSEANRPAEGSLRSPRERDSTEESRPPFSGSNSVAVWAAGGVGGVAPPRERSESQSTTASSRRPVGIVEDELRVGESAGNAGVGRAPS